MWLYMHLPRMAWFDKREEEVVRYKRSELTLIRRRRRPTAARRPLGRAEECFSCAPALAEKPADRPLDLCAMSSFTVNAILEKTENRCRRTCKRCPRPLFHCKHAFSPALCLSCTRSLLAWLWPPYPFFRRAAAAPPCCGAGTRTFGTWRRLTSSQVSAQNAQNAVDG